MEIRQFMKTEVASLPTTATIGEAARLIVEKGIGTFALVPVLIGLGNTGYNVQPLWWALAFGAGFGGKQYTYWLDCEYHRGLDVRTHRSSHYGAQLARCWCTGTCRDLHGGEHSIRARLQILPLVWRLIR